MGCKITRFYLENMLSRDFSGIFLIFTVPYFVYFEKASKSGPKSRKRSALPSDVSRKRHRDGANGTVPFSCLKIHLVDLPVSSLVLLICKLLPPRRDILTPPTKTAQKRFCSVGWYLFCRDNNSAQTATNRLTGRYLSSPVFSNR